MFVKACLGLLKQAQVNWNIYTKKTLGVKWGELHIKKRKNKVFSSSLEPPVGPDILGLRALQLLQVEGQWQEQII